MENFEIERILKTVNNNKIYIVLITLLTVVIGYIYSYYFKTPMYKASTTIILAMSTDDSQTDVSSEITQSDITLNQKLVSTYSEIIKSSKVVNAVIEEYDLNMSAEALKSRISVVDENNTEILKISVADENPELAATIANGLVEAFEKEVTSIYNINNISVIDEAKVPGAPYNINHAKDIIMALIMGLAISAGIIFLIYIFDTTIKIEEDLEQYIGLNVLSSIPIYSKKSKNTTTTEKYEEVITYEDAKSPVAEAFRTLRTNLVFGQEKDSLKTILITSSYTSEGKSWISSNMAVTFAQTNKKVLIIDCDMRKGRQHHIFNVSSRPGLSNCLTKLDEFKSISDISEYIKETDIPNLHIMTGGDRPSNPSELVSSKRMEALLHIMNQIYDIVILDGTPSTIVSDSIVLSRIADATILVTACKETKIGNVQKIKKLIENADGKIAGAVLNKVPVSQKEYQNKYYYSDRGDRGNLRTIETKTTETTTVEQLITRLNSNIQQNQTLIDSVAVQDRPRARRSKKVDKSLFGENLLEQNPVIYNSANEIQDKIGNINNEMDTIKNIFAQILINSQNQIKDGVENKIQTTTIKEKLEDLKLICRDIQEVQNTSTLQKTAEEIKLEIEQINEACKTLDIKDEKTKQLITQQISQMQETYNSILDEKLAIIKDTDSTEEIKKKLTDLQKFILATVTENNSQTEIEELKEKLDNIEQVYNSYEQMLDEKLYKMQKNIIEATKEQRVEKFRDRINSVKEVYSKELTEKLRALEERLVNNTNTKGIEEKLDQLKIIYTGQLNQNLLNIENLLLKTTKAEDVIQLENKLDQIQQTYINKLEQNVSNIENALSQVTKIEHIQHLENKLDENQQMYVDKLQQNVSNIEGILSQVTKTEQVQQLENKLNENQQMYVDRLQQNVSNIENKVTEAQQTYLENLDLKFQNVENIRSMQEEYKAELNEKLSNLESVLEKYNNSDNIIEIKQEIQMLKNIYSQELEEKISSLQQMIDQNAKAEEMKKIQKEMKNMKEEMYGLKQELYKQTESVNKVAATGAKKLINIEEIKDPHMIRLNNMKAEMEMHKQYKEMINDNYLIPVAQERKAKRNPFWRRQEDNSLFAVKQSFMEDIEQIEAEKRSAGSVSQILNFNNDSRVV